ncbi:MAG: ATP--guanido phosphotransferase, partial [Candidatus Omnitrophica bacterium]|nr:ATP--guanido phosphotransferase [Candidatus Omnitrophota bacterium]
MQINDLLSHASEWLKGTGPNSDVVISSRVRLARNLNKYPFPHWAGKVQGEQVIKVIEGVAANIDYLK